MRYYADRHIHSYYSRATSKQLNREHLNLWTQLKGIEVVGTGDFGVIGIYSDAERILQVEEC